MTTLMRMEQLLWTAALVLSLPLTGCASGPTWKEEVVVFDGSKAVVERQVILGNLLDQEFSDVRHGPPVKGNILRSPLADGRWTRNGRHWA